ncbi:MAG: energy-coupling factor ABC transporter ATP-binding protein [Candidatus Altiarchaeales archaeon WOR_SM1_86-2]|nr:MAG: energy-coupling factor ABC transporter ATP-binding protein [Candidatus Altiarchaeales archaeon WOR_SM1_86-2]
MKKVIEIRGLAYDYPDGTEALRGVNMDVFENQSVCLIGPNGSGKTTLLLHLNGILEGNNGSVRILGMDVNKNLKKIRAGVGMVFQDPDDQLFSPTVFDDVAFGPINMGLSEGYKNKCPHHLSFGEKKKISLAGVLSMDPEILALDEPTANLDPKSRRDLIKIIQNLKEEGKTIITATHDLNAVPDIVDRIYILNKTIIGEGTTRDMFLNAELLKSQNLDIPDTAILFEVLSCFGYDPANLPLSIDDAIEHLTKTIGTEGGHIHLHFHEHTHDKLTEVRKKHGHHGHV